MKTLKAIVLEPWNDIYEKKDGINTKSHTVSSHIGDDKNTEKLII